MASTRPCPICNGTGCKCCGGQGRIPYPWTMPDDPPVQQRWTIEEVEVIAGAATATEAYHRYCAVFGEYERGLSSVRHRWLKNCGTANCWEAGELAVIDEATTPRDAAILYIAAYGANRTPHTIKMRWYRLTQTRKEPRTERVY